MVIVITATRGSRAEFLERPLGRSLARMSFDATLQYAVIENNQAGLPAAFNRFIVEEMREHALVFMHDDVWIDDLFFSDRIRAALDTFDVAGLAGNRRLLPGAPAWLFKNDAMEWDSEFLSGIVCHGAQPFGAASVYGPTPAPVQLLDGVLLAARLRAAGCGGALRRALRLPPLRYGLLAPGQRRGPEGGNLAHRSHPRQRRRIRFARLEPLARALPREMARRRPGNRLNLRFARPAAFRACHSWSCG